MKDINEAMVNADQTADTTVKTITAKKSAAPKLKIVKPAKEKSIHKTQATCLIELVINKHVKLFHDKDGQGYASIPTGDHTENWPIHSKGFKDWLAKTYYATEKKTPCNNAMQDALATLEGQARYGAPEYCVGLRIAGDQEVIYVDLGDANWRTVRITQDGWKITTQTAIKFVRRRGMRALPECVHNGSLELLWRYLNVQNDADKKLIIGWLLAALRPTGPYTILVLQGEQGSAKSTAARVLRDLIDPALTPLRTLSRNEHDLMIAALNSWVLAFDNLSGLSPLFSDAFCRIATGVGFTTRQLYTDSDELNINVQRPIILNGIDDIATRQDLIGRAIIITLPTIPEDKYKSEDKFWADFERDRPRILASLFDAVVGALKNLPTTDLEHGPRMADFAKWVTAAEPALHWEAGSFMKAYKGNRQAAIETGLEGSPVAQVIRDLLTRQARIEGTASDLLDGFEKDNRYQSMARRTSWPKSGDSLGDTLKRLATPLRAIGISVEFKRTNTRRIIRIEEVGI